jgi:hypothetical protein
MSSPRPFILVLLALTFPFSAVPQTSSSPAEDYSGMYSFLKEGEFVQMTIEEQGAVSGFISRYGDAESDKGSFLDQFFKSGKIDGKNITFSTESVHGVWFTFDGVIERGPAKKPDEEGYYVLRGTLRHFSSDAEKKVTSQARRVELKSFPRDVLPSK